MDITQEQKMKEAATKYARAYTGYAPADSEEYQAAYKHFLYGANWLRDQEPPQSSEIERLTQLLAAEKTEATHWLNQAKGQSAEIERLTKEKRDLQKEFDDLFRQKQLTTEYAALKLKEKVDGDKEIERLREALRVVNENFPLHVMRDHLAEDYDIYLLALQPQK